MITFSNPLSIINGTVSTTTDYDRIVKDQVIDAITTNQGERVMHPTWGCNIQSFLYDPASSLERQDAAAYIRDQLVHMVPRALIMSVDVHVGIDELNKVYIDIVFKPSNYAPASSVTVAVDVTNTNPVAGVTA
jgi:phage baseplate assembly protein W